MALKRGTDPFGDGSLKFSWTFTNPADGTAYNDSEQSVTNTICNTSDIIIDANTPHGLNKYTTPSGSNSTSSQLSHGFDSSTSFTMNYWSYVDNANDASPSILGVGTTFATGSCSCGYYTSGTDYITIGNYDGTYYNFGVEDTAGWHYMTVMWDAPNGTIYWYKDGTELYHVAISLTPDSTQKISYYSTATLEFISDITVFNRTLTPTEISDLMNDNFAGAQDNVAQPDVVPITLTSDRVITQWSWLNRGTNPFGDNSDLAMWTFTDNDTGDAIIDCVEGGNTFSSLTNVVSNNSTPYSLNPLQGNSGGQYSQNNIPYSGGADATLTFWAKLDISSIIADGSVSIGEHFTTGAIGIGWKDDNGVPKYTFQIGNTYYWLSEVVNTWEEYVHLAVTVDGANGNIRVTRNGVELISLTGQTINFDNTKKTEFYSAGNVDYVSDICLWNRVLTDAEIEKLRTDDFVKGGFVSADINEIIGSVNNQNVRLGSNIFADNFLLPITANKATAQSPIIYPNSFFVAINQPLIALKLDFTVYIGVIEISSTVNDIHMLSTYFIEDLKVNLLIPYSQGTIIAKHEAQSLFISIVNPIKYAAYTPIHQYYTDERISAKITFNEPLISFQPVVDRTFVLIRMTVNSPLIIPHNEIVSPHNSLITITTNPPIQYSSNADLNIMKISFNPPRYFDSVDVVVDVDVCGITVYFDLFYNPVTVLPVYVILNTPNFIGQLSTTATAPTPTVMAQSIKLSIVPQYLKVSKNVYVKPQPMNITITKNVELLWERVLLNSFELTITMTSSVAQPYKNKRVISIDDIIFNEKMLWEQNIVSNTFDAVGTKMLDGSTVYSILPKKQFSRPYKIMSNNVIMLTKDVVYQLKALSRIDEHKLIFDDGSFEYMKFDLTKPYMKITPVYEGGDYFFVYIEVLI